MATYIPAMRARMGDLEYFASVVTMGEAARMIEYVEKIDDWTPETPPELKLQRKLNVQRVEREMVPYLLLNKDHFYSALTVEIRPVPNGGERGTLAFSTQQEFPGGLTFGTLTLDGTESLYALDGQHRLKSIELAVRQNPELAREHITLILVPFKAIRRSQTLFSDLNRYAKTPSKSISLLFTHREPLARIAKTLGNSIPLLQDRVNMESTSLSSKSRHFITLSTLYEMTRALAEERIDRGNDENGVVSDLADVWATLTDAIPQWRIVADSREHPAYLRQRYLSMHGVAQQAIGLATAQARNASIGSWKRYVKKFKDVDWRLTNPDWEGIALHGGRVNNTATSIRSLANNLSQRIGLQTKDRKANGDGRGRSKNAT